MAHHSDIPPGASRLPEEPVQRLVGPFARFMRIEAACGAVLLVCAVVALWAANSSFAEGYLAFWETPIGISIGEHDILVFVLPELHHLDDACHKFPEVGIVLLGIPHAGEVEEFFGDLFAAKGFFLNHF